MAEQAAEGGVTVFVYLGGEQEVPRNVTHVRIDRSVKIIPARAFYEREQLVSVEMHDGIEKIEHEAFYGCISLRGIELPGVMEVGYSAFNYCKGLTDVEFGDKLETIVEGAFYNCRSLQKIEMPSVRTIGWKAFTGCEQLTDVELPAVETIEKEVFFNCDRLRRISIPLKDNLFAFDTDYQRYSQFDYCGYLTTVDLVGGIHKTISSFLLESWRSEIYLEIYRINQVLPNTPARHKTDAIQEWVESVINRMEHYKAEHNRILKEDMTQLELALWKANLDENNANGVPYQDAVRVTRGRIKRARKEKCITSGAGIIIKNVLPFLRLE